MVKIRRMKRGYNEPNIICYDIETYVINDRMEFRLGVLNCEGFAFTFYDVDLFTNAIIGLTEKRKTNVIVAHNAQFDFSLLVHDYFNDFKLRMFSTNPFIIHYVHKDSHKHNTNIIFIDSLAFFKNSLDELGKIFGKEKIVVDVLRNKFDTEIDFYCVRDTLIVCDIMKFIDEQCIKYDIPFPVTFAQMAYMIYKKHFLKLVLMPPNIPAIMEHERHGYFGGRVEAFNFNKTDAKVYDINSLYPFVMRENYFPISLVGYYNNINCIENQEVIMAFLQDKIEEKSLVMARVLVKIEPCFIAPIPKRMDGKIMFPVGTFETVLCTPELDLVKDSILEVRELTHYVREKIFSNYVDTFYSERQKYPKEHPNNLFYKLLMNSLYGKFGQRRFEFTRYEKYDDILKYGATDLDINDNEELIRIEFFNGKAYRKDIFQDNEHSFVAIAAFVTSYARVELYKSLINNLDIIYYCDTDSMILKRKPNGIIEGVELGEWKEEKPYTDFECLGNKHYRAKGVLKVKGVPKTAEVLSDFSFRFEKITKMKESIIRFEEPIPHVIMMTKNYTGKYDKRIIRKDKTTVPIKLIEGQEELILPISFLPKDEN